MMQLEENTNRVKRINTKAVLIGVAVAIVVIVAAILLLSRNERTLTGKVIDASTNTAISGAKVYLENAPSEIVLTDSEGVFSIDLKEETDSVKVLVRADGFRWYNGVTQLSPGTTKIEIRLKPLNERPF